MKGNMRKILTLALLAVFLVSTAILIKHWADRQKSNASYNNAESLAYASQPSSTEAATEPETLPPTEATEATEPPKKVWIPAPVEDDDPNLENLAGTDLAALREVNGDVLGWITIPGTRVNYPIVQGADNAYYLDYTWDNKPSICGSIFLECMNSPDFTDFNTIIYGHNINDGSMFAALHNYAYQNYWSEHPYVYIVTDAGVYRYEIFSSYHANIDSSTYGLSFNQTETRENFLSMALELSEIDTGITPAITDRVITLSTCTGWTYDTRRVVHARLPMIESDET